MPIRCSRGGRIPPGVQSKAGVAFGPQRVSDEPGSNSTDESVGTGPEPVKAVHGEKRTRAERAAGRERFRTTVGAAPRSAARFQRRAGARSPIGAGMAIAVSRERRGREGQRQPTSLFIHRGLPPRLHPFTQRPGRAHRPGRGGFQAPTSTTEPYDGSFRCRVTESGSMRTRAVVGMVPSRRRPTRCPTRSPSGNGAVQ
jgi:hypothetical protein